MIKYVSVFFVLMLCSISINSQSTGIVKLPTTNSTIKTFAIDDKLIIYPNGDKLDVWDIDKNSIVKSYPFSTPQAVRCIGVSDSLRYICYGTTDGQLVILSNDFQKIIYDEQVSEKSITSLAFIDDMFKLLVGCNGGQVYELDLLNLEPPKLFFTGIDEITSINYSNQLGYISISGGNQINIFKDHSGEWLTSFSIKKGWVRETKFEASNKRLFAVGDDGMLREWKIGEDDNFVLIRSNRVSANWLLSLDVGNAGDVIATGGLNHNLQALIKFGQYDIKLKGPLLQTKIIQDNERQIKLVCCVYGVGIQIVSLNHMKFKSLY
nr:hypothetical protein [uncultured Carboxylicivirga sp.]